MRISTSGVNMAASVIARETMTALEGRPYSLPGDQAPPQVRQPILLFAMAAQTNPYAAATNTITVFLESNVDLPQASAISLTGFTGALSAASLSLGAAEGGNGAQNLFQDIGATGVSASWQASTHTIKLYLINNLSAMSRIGFTFSLTNPAVGSSGDAAGIEALSLEVGIRPRVVMGDDETLLCGIPGSTRGEAQPLTIRATEFTIKEVSQNSTFPDDVANVISVKLQTNARLSDCTITISGLPSSLSRSLVELKSLGSAGSSNVFTVGGNISTARIQSGVLLLRIDAPQAVEPYTPVAFSFDIRNPPTQRDAAQLYISACGVMPTSKLMTAPLGSITGLAGSVPGMYRERERERARARAR